MKRYKAALAILMIVLATVMPSVTKAQQLDPILKGLINKGLNKSHSLNSKRMDAEQAKVDQQLAKAVFLPKITLNGSYTHLNDDITFDENTRTLLTETQKLVIKDATGLPFNSTFPNPIPLREVPVLQNQNILRSSIDVDWVLFSGLEASNALQASKHKEASLNYVGVGVKWNVFHGNQSRLKRKKIQLESAKYREQIEDAHEMVALGISKAEISYESSLLNTKIVQKEIDLANENYEMVNTQYKNNLASINDVLDVLNDVEKANFKLQESYFKERRAVADLLHAKGILNYQPIKKT